MSKGDKDQRRYNEISRELKRAAAGGRSDRVHACGHRCNCAPCECPCSSDECLTIYAKLKAAGVPLDHHESDLYAKVTEESRAIVKAYRWRENVTTFTSQIDGTPWYDIPFAFDPLWQRKGGKVQR